jgi:hypothetical protein
VLDVEIETEADVLSRPQQAVQLRRPVQKHELLGKQFRRVWKDATGCQQEVRGKITKCWSGNRIDNEAFFFTVEYSLRPHARIPAIDHTISEYAAWGGYMASRIATQSPLSVSPPFYYTWILPSNPTRKQIPGLDLPALELLHGNFVLRLYVKESSIPRAGLGLWLKCTRLEGDSTETSFVLPKGHLLHIGCYGPLRDEDMKSEVVYAIKNFIHKTAASSWCYRYEQASGHIDMTDDWSGELHPEAQQNLVGFANEVSHKSRDAGGLSKTAPRVLARPDPAGVVHYYIGRDSPRDDIVVLPTDNPIELLVSCRKVAPCYDNDKLQSLTSSL